MSNVRNYLYDIEIPSGDAKIDLTFDVKYYAMDTAHKIEAEMVTNKLKYWLKTQVYELEKKLQAKIQSLKETK